MKQQLKTHTKEKEEIKPKKIINSGKKVKKQEELGKEKFAQEIISLLRSLKTTSEVAEIMGCSLSHIHKTRRDCIANGTWMTEEEEKAIRKKIADVRKTKRKNVAKTEKSKKPKESKREIQERLKKEQALIEREAQERKIAEELDKLMKLEFVDRSTTATNIKPYNFIKKAAKQEDRLEYNGEEEVSTKGREAFIESVLKLHSLGWNNFTDKDFQLIADSFYIHPKLANKRIIKFLVSNAVRKNGWNSALDTVQDLMSSLEDTEFYNGLREYSDWIRKQSYVTKIKRLKSNGMNNTEIADRIGMSSAEVMILLDNSKKGKIIDFDFK